ncbi:hypothetical protein UlMin_033804 [Ulmus minor]
MESFSNKIDKDELKPGDHIYAYRNLHFYSHHGIYVGENRVIHFTRTQVDTETSKSNIQSCKECGYNPKIHLGVVVCCLDCFLKGHSRRRFDYNVSSAHFAYKRSGTCSTKPCDAPDVVVLRAYQMLTEKDNAFGDYDLFYNNCESFAIYCKTGHSTSIQVSSMKFKAKMAFEDLTQQSLSVKNVVKTLSKVGIMNKLDKFHHDIELHQQDNQSQNVGPPGGGG